MTTGIAITYMGCNVAAKALDTERIAWLGEWLRTVLAGGLYDSADSWVHSVSTRSTSFSLHRFFHSMSRASDVSLSYMYD